MSNSKAKTAVLLCGHGSSNPVATEEFHCLVAKVQEKLTRHTVTGAFLEFNQPNITTALQDIYDQGVREIIVQPLTIYNASHTQKDIPEILANFSNTRPDVKLHYGAFLGLTLPVIEATIFGLQSVMPAVDLEDCKLLVVGRASQNREVADQTINLCRKLHNWLDFGDSRYCYSHGSPPLLRTALNQAGQSHYPHVIVLPFLLFPGRLLSDIYHEIDAAAEKYPDFTFYKAPHLGPQDYIAQAIILKIKDYVN